MTPLRKLMIEELQLGNLSDLTIQTYVKAVGRFAKAKNCRASLFVPTTSSSKNSCRYHPLTLPMYMQRSGRHATGQRVQISLSPLFGPACAPFGL